MYDLKNMNSVKLGNKAGASYTYQFTGHSCLKPDETYVYGAKLWKRLD